MPFDYLLYVASCFIQHYLVKPSSQACWLVSTSQIKHMLAPPYHIFCHKNLTPCNQSFHLPLYVNCSLVWFCAHLYIWWLRYQNRLCPISPCPFHLDLIWLIFSSFWACTAFTGIHQTMFDNTTKVFCNFSSSVLVAMVEKFVHMLNAHQGSCHNCSQFISSTNISCLNHSMRHWNNYIKFILFSSFMRKIFLLLPDIIHLLCYCFVILYIMKLYYRL